MSEQDPTLSGLEETLNGYFVTKAPFQFPDNVKEILVKIAPWLAIIMIVFSLPAILALLGIGFLATPFLIFPYSGFYMISYYIGIVFLALQVIVMAICLPGLFARKRSAWKLLYYSQLLSFAHGIFNWLTSPTSIGSLIGALIGAVIGFYIVFQVREKYN